MLSHSARQNDCPEILLKDRRSVLGSLGLAGFGLVASSVGAGAATPGKTPTANPKVTVPTSSGTAKLPALNFSPAPGLPEEWASTHGTMAAGYLRYLQSLKLQHVCPAQVVETHAKEKGGVWNTIPPKAWWNRMGYVLKVADRIAREMRIGSQIEIVSAYRAPAYNARCPGAKSGSWHQANVAVDVKFPVRASQVTATARELRNLGLFRGGVGGYWDFTHIDARGQNIDW
jgi:hypothetical protein